MQDSGHILKSVYPVMKKINLLLLALSTFLSISDLYGTTAKAPVNAGFGGISSLEECMLSELELKQSDCTQGGEFYVTINFSYQNTSECFRVKGNGHSYGEFPYTSLPIKLGPFKGDCKTEYEFIVIDCQNEPCNISKSLGTVCCPAKGDCMLSELQLKKSDCTAEKEFYMTLNFNYKNTSDSFKVQGNGVKYGTYSYKTLPVKIGPLKGNCETSYEFVIFDAQNERCRLDSVYGKVCCEAQGDCEIGEIKWEKTDCKEGQFYLLFKFPYANTSECFRIKGNGQDYGSFPYTPQPIKIGPFKGDCTTNYSFAFIDCKNEHCAREVNVGKVCCEAQSNCEIGEIKWEKTACKEGQFYLVMNFAYKNTSDCFKVKGNGQDYGTFTYAQLPIKIGPLKGDCTTNYSFAVIDCKNERCGREVNVGKICCEAQGNCEIGEIKWEKTDCQEGQFYLLFKFAYANTSECFRIKGNGQDYGTFPYSPQPIKIGPFKGDCTTNYSFAFIDCKNEKCAREVNVGKVCCEAQGNCEIGEIKWEKTTCKEGQFYVVMNFAYKNTSDCFRVKGNGQDYGTFAYTQLPIKIGPLKGDCTTNYGFAVIDCKNERCGREVNVGKVCCEAQGNCEIGEIKWEKTECKEGQFYLLFKFPYANTSECFRIKGNGHDYGTFPYTPQPIKIGPFKGDCTTNYSFAFIDCKNEKCVREVNIGKICCEAQGNCEIGEIKWEKTACKEGQFYVVMNFAYKNTSDCFKVKGNGQDYGTFTYAQLPIKIGPLKGDCTTNYSFAVIDCKNERCGREFNIGKVCCEAQGNCEIGEIKWERSDCKEGQFYLFFKFPYANTSECFRLKGNGHDYGTFPYTPQPIKIGPFKGDCATNYSFAFIDCKNERCAREVNVGKVCCETQGNCEIGEIKYEKTQCKEGEFYISFNFAHHNNSECFTLKGNGKDYGKFNYDSLPIKIGPLKGDCVTKYEFIFRDCANEKCARELNLGTVCCEQKGESCEIFNLEVTPLECTGTNQYSVRINFGHKGTKGVGFDVFDRKGSIGFYAYSDLPIVIENFKKSGLSYDFIKICENDNEKCCKAAEFEPLNCFGIGKGFFTLEDLQVYGSTSGLVVESIFPFPSGFELEVFDLGGRTLSTQIIEKTSNRMLVRIHQYLPGMYVLKTRYSYDTRPFKFLR